MAMPTCDNDGKPTLRVVTNVETGEQHFYCLECFGAAQDAEPTPDFRAVCDVCVEQPTALVVRDVVTGVTQSFCRYHEVVAGRVTWLFQEDSVLEIASEEADTIYAQTNPQPEKKRGRRPKLAVDNTDSAPQAVETSPEESGEQVEENDAPDAEAAQAQAQ